MSAFDAVLKVRGWLVFALLFGSFVLGFGAIALSAFPLEGGPKPFIFGLGMALWEFMYFGWALAVGASMNSRLPPGLSRGFLFPAVGLVVATGYMYWFAGVFAAVPGAQPFGAVQIGLHLFSMVVNFYLFWFVSRGLVAAEEQRKPPLDRILGLFFVLWFTAFLPIGAWWAHNRARAVAQPGAP